MAYEEVKFRRGLHSTTPTAKVPGTLLVETDTGDVFLDNTTTERIQLTDSRKMSKSGGEFTGPIVGTKISASEVHATTLHGTLEGTATAAQKDASGQIITSTYVKDIEIDGTSVTVTKGDGTAATLHTQDTTLEYSAGSGLALSGDRTFTNTGVLSIDTGSGSGTISVNTGGQTSDVAVKGLKDAAYKEASSFAAASHSHSTATTSTSGFLSAEDKSKLDNLNKRIIGYAVTSGTHSAYIASIPGATLSEGTLIALKFSVTNSAGATLKLNTYADKPIYYKGGPIPAGHAPEDSVLLLIYDTTQEATGSWQCVYSYNNYVEYTNASLGQGFAICDTAENISIKSATISQYSLSIGGVIAIRFAHAVPAASSLSINGDAELPIIYRNSAIPAGVITENSTASFIYDGEQYQLIAVDTIAPQNLYVNAQPAAASHSTTSVTNPWITLSDGNSIHISGTGPISVTAVDGEIVINSTGESVASNLIWKDFRD